MITIVNASKYLSLVKIAIMVLTNLISATMMSYQYFGTSFLVQKFFGSNYLFKEGFIDFRSSLLTDHFRKLFDSKIPTEEILDSFESLIKSFEKYLLGIGQVH